MVTALACLVACGATYYAGRLHEATSGPIHPEVKAKVLTAINDGVKDSHLAIAINAVKAMGSSQPAK